MLKEIFIGRQPSHFQMNPIIKAFIVAEMFLWSAWNFITPIFAVFATNIPGGGVEIAASAFSTYLIVRVIFELVSGKYLAGTGELEKFLITIMGMIIMSAAYIGFAFTQSVSSIFLYYGVIGIGLGIATPAKNSLFSSHLDKNKETFEWGLVDASVFIGMALSAVVGGFIANKYGFQLLFLVAAVVNLLGTIPYILYLHQEKKHLLERPATLTNKQV
jgi:MFS family permease